MPLYKWCIIILLYTPIFVITIILEFSIDLRNWFWDIFKNLFNVFLLCSLNSKGCSINFHCIFCQICHHIMLPHKYSSQLLLGHVHLTFLVILVMCSILQSHRKNLSIYIIAWNMYILLCFIAYFFNFIISSRDCSHVSADIVDQFCFLISHFPT